MTKYQNQDERDIPRSQIHGAPYNPRKIYPVQLRRLRENIKRRKLQGGIVVNERTEDRGWSPAECGYFVVSGHQRLSVLDALERSPEFAVRCAVMHLSPAEEREQNLHFNSAGAQGDFDVALLADVITFEGVDFEAAGFDALTLEDLGIIQSDLTDEAAASPEARGMANDAEAIAQAARDRKAAYRAQERAKDDEVPGQYVVLYYTGPDELDAFLTAVGNVADHRYVAMSAVLAAMGIEIQASEDADAAT